jgi:predicted SprT family Zn-dependent metalloprotease
MFVVSNWNANDLAFMEKVVSHEVATYIIVGEEVCPTTGTPHLQVRS